MRRLLFILFSLLFTVIAVAAAGAFVWFHYHSRAAQRAIGEFRLDEAQKHLDQCLLVWPRSSSVQYLAVQTARRRDALDEAEQRLDAWERRGGKNPATELERLLLRAYRGEIDEGSSKLYRLVESKHPDTNLILEAVCRAHMLQYNPDMAQMALNKLLERQPDNPIGRYLCGRSLEERGKDEEAVEEYRHALENAPAMFKPRLHLAGLLFRLGLMREAIYHYEWLKQGNPEDARVLVGLARCRLDQNELTECGRLLDSALAADPDHVSALVERGRLAVRTGKAAEAVAGLRRATALAPYEHDAWWVLHLCLETIGETEEDRRCLDEVFRIESNSLRLHNLMLEIAEKDDNPELRYEVGIRLLQAGKDDDGVRVLSILLEMEPNHPGASKALDEHHQRSRQENGKRKPTAEPPL